MKLTKISLFAVIALTCFMGSMEAASADLKILDGACSFEDLILTVNHDGSEFTHAPEKGKIDEVRSVFSGITIQFKKATYKDQFGRLVNLGRENIGVLVLGKNGLQPKMIQEFESTGKTEVPMTWGLTFVFYRK